MNDLLSKLIFVAGWGQLSVLIAAALVPIRLNWRESFQPLSRLHRQMYWVYGGYVVLSIIAFGLLSLLYSRELAGGSGLARGFCLYISIFWGIRLGLQAVLDVKRHLTAWWLNAGYFGLTFLFAFFTGVFGWSAIFAEPTPEETPLMASRSPLEPGETTIRTADDAIRRFQEVRREIRYPVRPEESITATRELTMNAWDLFERGLLPQEKIHAPLFGESIVLNQKGSCWVVVADTPLGGGLIACFNDSGRLLFAWRFPEG